MERSDLSAAAAGGSKDGDGAGDNDLPYVFGRRPRAIAPWPFTERQYAHLLLMRGRHCDAPNPADRLEAHPMAIDGRGVRIASSTDLRSKARQRRAA